MKADYSIELMCEVLKVGRSSYYDWKQGYRRPPQNHDPLKAAKRDAFQRSRGTYGYRRVNEELEGEAVLGRRKLILRLMKAMELEAAPWKQSPYAAARKTHESIVCPNLVDRKFRPSGPNQVWTGDITYIRTPKGWIYLAVVWTSSRGVWWAGVDPISLMPLWSSPRSPRLFRGCPIAWKPYIPLRPRLPIYRSLLPRLLNRARYPGLDEPKRPMLGQRPPKVSSGPSSEKRACAVFIWQDCAKSRW